MRTCVHVRAAVESLMMMLNSKYLYTCIVSLKVSVRRALGFDWTAADKSNTANVGIARLCTSPVTDTDNVLHANVVVTSVVHKVVFVLRPESGFRIKFSLTMSAVQAKL